MPNKIKLGDFSLLAKNYTHRAGYSQRALKMALDWMKLCPNLSLIADIGAGTGKLTEQLIENNFCGYAIEPNTEMFKMGRSELGDKGFTWHQGKAEKIPLSGESVDAVFMASSFHWTNPSLSLPEFKRILKPEGWFIALWNPVDLKQSKVHREIEGFIHQQFPGISRNSSGRAEFTANLTTELEREGLFHKTLFVEAHESIVMSTERYLGIWRSVNDIRAQIGEKSFEELLGAIQDKIKVEEKIEMTYKTRLWMAQATPK